MINTLFSRKIKEKLAELFPYSIDNDKKENQINLATNIFSYVLIEYYYYQQSKKFNDCYLDLLNNGKLLTDEALNIGKTIFNLKNLKLEDGTNYYTLLKENEFNYFSANEELPEELQKIGDKEFFSKAGFVIRGYERLWETYMVNKPKITANKIIVSVDGSFREIINNDFYEQEQKKVSVLVKNEKNLNEFEQALLSLNERYNNDLKNLIDQYLSEDDRHAELDFNNWIKPEISQYEIAYVENKTPNVSTYNSFLRAPEIDSAKVYIKPIIYKRLKINDSKNGEKVEREYVYNMVKPMIIDLGSIINKTTQSDIKSIFNFISYNHEEKERIEHILLKTRISAEKLNRHPHIQFKCLGSYSNPMATALLRGDYKIFFNLIFRYVTDINISDYAVSSELTQYIEEEKVNELLLKYPEEFIIKDYTDLRG